MHTNTAEGLFQKLPPSHTISAAQWTALLATILYMVQCAALAKSLCASQWYWKQPYHTSALTGAEWVEELIYSHPDRIKNCLGTWATEIWEAKKKGAKTLREYAWLAVWQLNQDVIPWGTILQYFIQFGSNTSHSAQNRWNVMQVTQILIKCWNYLKFWKNELKIQKIPEAHLLCLCALCS